MPLKARGKKTKNQKGKSASNGFEHNGQREESTPF